LRRAPTSTLFPTRRSSDLGMHSPTNGVPEGVIRNFTMLVAVFLSEVAGPYSGNFTVWPGTHHEYERYFSQHSPQSLLEGMPPIRDRKSTRLNSSHRTISYA